MLGACHASHLMGCEEGSVTKRGGGRSVAERGGSGHWAAATPVAKEVSQTGRE
ncbi:hypothetical protein JCM4914_31720 [Streptomyces platensis subsp. malvinus]